MTHRSSTWRDYGDTNRALFLARGWPRLRHQANTILGKHWRQHWRTYAEIIAAAFAFGFIAGLLHDAHQSRRRADAAEHQANKYALGAPVHRIYHINVPPYAIDRSGLIEPIMREVQREANLSEAEWMRRGGM